MKIYFVASIKGREKYRENYERIITLLGKKGHQVVEQTLSPSTKDVYGLSDHDKILFYKKVLKWINQADIVIAETSYPSLGIGFEISQALEKGKPVVVLYTEEETPHLIQGVESEKLFLVKYGLDNLSGTLDQIIKDAKEQMDVRFNFFIPPKIGAYLDWISKNKKIPRAVYLRRLIEEDLKKNKDYQV
jgi:hypothetical protein